MAKLTSGQNDLAAVMSFMGDEISEHVADVERKIPRVRSRRRNAAIVLATKQQHSAYGIAAAIQSGDQLLAQARRQRPSVLPGVDDVSGLLLSAHPLLWAKLGGGHRRRHLRWNHLCRRWSRRCAPRSVVPPGLSSQITIGERMAAR